MEYHSVLFDTDESVAIMTLNRPDKMNAYSNELGDEFLDGLERVKKDPRIRVLIITGAGRAFCSGVDLEQCRQALEDRKKGNKEWHDYLLQWITTTPKIMMELDKPIIAAINGAAIGMGCSIALACDNWLILGKPPAMPGRLPEFDICGNIRKPPEYEPLNAHRQGGFR